MRKEFGTPYVDKYSKEELFLESKSLILCLFSINKRESTIVESDYKKILRLFEIIKFCKDKYPFLLTLKFNENILSEVNVWKDPHFYQSEGVSTAFIGSVYALPDLSVLSNNQKLILNSFDSFLSEPDNLDILKNTICIAGNQDNILNIGKARQSVFERQNIQPLISLIDSKFK